jgi:hypothetical protein
MVARKGDGDQRSQACRRTQLEPAENFSPTSVHERPNTIENRRVPETRRARRFNNLLNPTKSAKPPPPVQIRPAPPIFPKGIRGSQLGGRLRLVALIDQVSVVQRILRHLGLPTEVPEPRLARTRLETLEDQSRDAPEFDGVMSASRPARRVSARRGGPAPTVISHWQSRLFGDNRPEKGALSALS